MALLNRFLQLLEFLEQAMDTVDSFLDRLTVPAGVSLMTCLLSYEALAHTGCDRLSSSILASAIALTLHCGLNRPNS
ncbi:MAG: hypothetical protein WBA10_16240 [Elainellaceae cyanobacterium]